MYAHPLTVQVQARVRNVCRATYHNIGDQDKLVMKSTRDKDLGSAVETAAKESQFHFVVSTDRFSGPVVGIIALDKYRRPSAVAHPCAY